MEKDTGRFMSLAVSLVLFATGCSSDKPAATSETVPPRVMVFAIGAMQQGAIKIHVTNSDRQLRAGMLAEGLKGDTAASGWQLPASAIVQKDGKAYVYTVDGDTVHLTAVTVGETKDSWVTVTEGLSAQDQVVAQPAGTLKDGHKVRVN